MLMDGTLIINKPDGWTSHDVVAKLRRILRTKRIGHTGTLDPFATGVLVVCVGRATRLVQFLIGMDKEYIATVRLGFATDTQDYTGKPVTPFQSSEGMSLQDVRLTLNEFIGNQSQLPPMFSAKKVGGVVLHKAARAGREVEREPVQIHIEAIDLINDESFRVNPDGTKDFQIRVSCSSGTYIRTLAHDVGVRLGVAAHLAALHRTRVGHFGLTEAVTLEEAEIKSQNGSLSLMNMSASVRHLPRVVIDEMQILYMINGREVRVEMNSQILVDRKTENLGSTPVRVVNGEDQLIAVGDFDLASDVVKPRVVFN
jgi:tRNA pseudouridine55 synthase